MTKTIYQAGERFPGPMPQAEGCHLGIHQESGELHVIVALRKPTPSEIQNFRGNWELRVYERPDMPGGLIMLGMAKNPQKPWVVELPFDALLEMETREEAMHLRLQAEPTAMYGFLVDLDTGILLANHARGLSQEFLECLADHWHDQIEGNNPGDYYRDYDRLIALKTTNQLWSQARRFSLVPPKAKPQPRPVDPTIPRPLQQVRAMSDMLPEIWKRIDEAREKIQSIPAWCWMPFQDMAAVLAASYPESNINAETVTTLAAWRTGQGIYRFDPDLYKAVSTTDLEGRVPWDSLYHLPEWCMYIETPGFTGMGTTIHGFFACLNLAVNSPCLYLAVDADAGIRSVTLPLGESISGSDSHAIHHMISLVLYLCSENPDISSKPIKSHPKKTKEGLRNFPPDKPNIWPVGSRIGAAIRRGSENKESANDGKEGTHAPKRAHLRKAHWHSFWVGSRKNNEQKLSLRWLMPILVGSKWDQEEKPAVVHRVL